MLLRYLAAAGIVIAVNLIPAFGPPTLGGARTAQAELASQRGRTGDHRRSLCRRRAVVLFVGRLVSYSLYVGGANLAQRSFGSVFEKAVKSPYGVALEIAMLAGIVLLTRIDWAKRLDRDGHTSGRAHAQRDQHSAAARARRRPGRS
jgi:hypothetical protein